MTCLVPFLFLLNVDGSTIAKIHPTQLKRNDPDVKRAIELCVRKLGTCPKSVFIKPNGHIHVTCKRKRHD